MDSVETAASIRPNAKSQADPRLIGIVLAGFCTFIDLYTTQSLLPLFRRIFHASEMAVSMMVSATTLAVALAAPFIGMVSERFGRKRIIAASTLGLAVPTLLAATAPNLHALIFWRFVQGLFLPGIFSVSIAYISEEWNAGGAGKAMSGYITGNVVGGFTGRFLSGLIAAHAGWRFAFLLIGALNLIGGAAVWRLLPLERHFKPAASMAHSMRTFPGHLRNPKLLATYAVAFNVLFSQVATFTYVSFYLAAKPFNLRADALGSLFFVYLLGVFITPMSGRAIDRFGHRNVLIAGVAASAAGVLLALGHVLWQEVLGLAISSSGVFVSQVAGSHVGCAAREARSTASGLYVTAYYIGGSAGAILPGLLWNFGGWPACVALIVAVQAITICVALSCWKPAAIVVPDLPQMASRRRVAAQ